jgi:hypothetical protein
MTAEEYKTLAEDFRTRARDQACPAFRAELEDLARCYEWAATATANSGSLLLNESRVQAKS